MVIKKNKKNNGNNKYIEETMEEIFNIMEQLGVTDYDKNDFTTPPEQWHSEKIMFLINKNINDLHLRGYNPPSTTSKHLGLVCCLHNIGVSSINLTHSFSPTYLGYTHEYFSWKFESVRASATDMKDQEIKDKLKQIPLKEKPPIFNVEIFDEIPRRTISIYEQKENISRLFREVYLGLKKVTKSGDNSNNISIEKNLVDVVLLLIPFVITDFENLSVTRKNNNLEAEHIKGLDWAENGLNTTLKINALFKKPTISVSSIPKMENITSIEEIEAHPN